MITITKIPEQKDVFTCRSFLGAMEWLNMNAMKGTRYDISGNGRQFYFYEPTDEEIKNGVKGIYPDSWDIDGFDDGPFKTVTWG